MTASERIRRAREKAERLAQMTGLTYRVYANGDEAWLASPASAELWRDRQPLYVIRPR